MLKNDGIALFRSLFFSDDYLNIFGKIVLSPLILFMSVVVGLMDLLFCPYRRTEIYYNRPETDEEIRLSLHKESLNLEAIRRQELQKLAELKAKYEVE